VYGYSPRTAGISSAIRKSPSGSFASRRNRES
jgi:hypothetical protein